MDGEDILASNAFLPLPFRVLALLGLGIFCWASNLHILHLLGIDTSSVLDTRSEKLATSTPSSPWPSTMDIPSAISPAAARSRSTPSSTSHYPVVYKIFFVYSVWTISCYMAFNYYVHGDKDRMDRYSGIIALAALGVAAGLICPFDFIYRRERDTFLIAIRRCLAPSLTQPVYFCDVMLADILTSFAKVLGDVWVSTTMMLPAGSLMMSALDIQGSSEWIIPALISLPYIIRLRQCLAEYYSSDRQNTRAFWNALKYASSFPVIILSVMQKQLDSDVAKAEGAGEALQTTWHGEHLIFRLWLLSVVISSMYSFWWDVTNDWGLDLFKPANAPPPTPHPPSLHRIAMVRSASSSSLSELPISGPFVSTSPNRFYERPHPYGLRTPLYYRYPLVYYAAIIVNLVLRFTWSVKLSIHYHTFAELETGVFVVEACELLRRWLWVFFRVEWEACKKGLLPDDGLELKERDSLTAPSVWRSPS